MVGPPNCLGCQRSALPLTVDRRIPLRGRELTRIEEGGSICLPSADLHRCVSLAEMDVECFSYQPILQKTIAEIEDTMNRRNCDKNVIVPAGRSQDSYRGIQNVIDDAATQ